MDGKLDLYFGPMTSGKTTALIMRGIKESAVGAKVVYINSSHDTRNNLLFSTHNGQIKEEIDSFTTIKVNVLLNVNVKSFDIILIDEAHFFPDLNIAVRKWVLTEGKHVIIAALAGDIKLELIGQTHLLIPVATKIKKLKSRCVKCGNNGKHVAHYTVLKGEDDRIGQYKVGGTDEYEAVCVKHYMEK